MASQPRFPAPPVARPPAGQRQRQGHRALAPWALATAVLTGPAMAPLDAAVVNVAGPAVPHHPHPSGAAPRRPAYPPPLRDSGAPVTGARPGGRDGVRRP